MLRRTYFIILVTSIFLTGCSQFISLPMNEKITTKQASVKYIRRSASSEAGKEDLAAMNKAFEKMREMGCEDPLSWYYQSATHAVPERITGGNPLCRSYVDKDITPMKWGWNTCTHEDSEISELNFLIWHRIYIAHLEAIVRELSGKEDFALPYWDYTNPDERIMPALLRDENSNLYTASRLKSLNKGYPISSDMDPLLGSAVDDLMTDRTFAGFNAMIDNIPHGIMHNYIGGGAVKNADYGVDVEDEAGIWNPIYRAFSPQPDHQEPSAGMMGDVPSAGFDPIFWLHHANIDYLWQKWENSSRGSRPSQKDLEKFFWDKYQFFTPKREKIWYTAQMAYQAAFNPDYAYEDSNGNIIEAAKAGSQKADELVYRHEVLKKTLVWSEVFGVSVNNGVSFVPKEPLIVPSSWSKEKGALSLEMTISFPHQPKGLYTVYVVDSKREKKMVGGLSFFGAAHHSKKHHMNTGLMTKSFKFDVTDELTPNETFQVEIMGVQDSDDDLRVNRLSFYTY